MNSIFGIGVLEFVFILIFALIFLGPERLPKVTKDVLFFIRRLQRLSGDLTRQVNEEIGDLRELDPSFHMKELMGDEEEEEEEKSIGQGASQTASTAAKQTSAPSQPAQAAEAALAGSSEEKVEQTSAAQPALSDLNAAASANGRQGSETKGTGAGAAGTAIPSAPRASSARSAAGAASRSRAGSTQKRGVKTLSELRKQQRAKRQSKASGTDSSYLEERNKRARRRAEDRRQALAEQKQAQESASDSDESEIVRTESGEAVEASFPAGLDGDGSERTVLEAAVQAGEDSVEADKDTVAAVTEEAEGEGTEETRL